MRKCKYCHKLLKFRSHRKDEKVSAFAIRKYCDSVCSTRGKNVARGYHDWSKKKLTKYFLEKYDRLGVKGNAWPRGFRVSIDKYFSSWSDFLHTLNIVPHRDMVPLKRRFAVRDAIAYIKEEMDIVPGRVFEMNTQSLAGYRSIKSMTMAGETIKLLMELGILQRMRKRKVGRKITDVVVQPSYFLTR